ncbi:MAG: hypothetical protein QM811_02370 [Pirellulales bacterium]
MSHEQPTHSESTPGANRALILKDSHAHAGGNPYGFPMMMSDSADVTGRAFTFGKLLHAFRRRYLLATFVGLILGGAGFAAVYALLPDTYDVSSLLKFNVDSVYMGRVNENIDRGVFRDTQKQLLTSDVVLSMTLNEMDEDQRPISTLPLLADQKDAKAFIRNSVSVVNPTGTDLLSVRMNRRDPQQIVKILKALVKSFVKYQNEEEIRPITMTIAKLKKEYDDSTLQFRTLDDIIKNEIRMSKNTNDEFNRRELELLRNDMSVNEQMLRQLQTDRAVLARNIANVKYMNSDEGMSQIPEVMLETMYAEYPGYSEAMIQLRDSKKLLADRKARLSNPNNPQNRRCATHYPRIGETDRRAEGRSQAVSRLENASFAYRRGAAASGLGEQLDFDGGGDFHPAKACGRVSRAIYATGGENLRHRKP